MGINIIKGLDRIVIIIAIVSVIPFFFTGFELSKEIMRKNNAEYIKWIHSPIYKKYEKLREEKNEKDRFKKQRPTDPIVIFDPINDFFNSSPPRTVTPPIWLRIIGGILISVIGFFTVLFTFKGTTRTIRWFALWLIEGFQE